MQFERDWDTNTQQEAQDPCSKISPIVGQLGQRRRASNSAGIDVEKDPDGDDNDLRSFTWRRFTDIK